jgi:hypothetical protein
LSCAMTGMVRANARKQKQSSFICISVLNFDIGLTNEGPRFGGKTVQAENRLPLFIVVIRFEPGKLLEIFGPLLPDENLHSGATQKANPHPAKTSLALFLGDREVPD